MKLGWVDFSRSDREKVMSVIDLLREPGTLDELGVGPIRDGFANLFFPGTSTIQTRAKYFLIVPYILREAASGQYGQNYQKVMARIDQEEHGCGKILVKNCPEEIGIVGGRVLPDGWVKRTPATIYWNGIVTYGLFTGNRLSMPQAVQVGLRRLSENSINERMRVKTDDEADDRDAGQSIRFPSFQVPDEFDPAWRDSLKIDLTESEARFLAEHILKSVPNSLMAYVLRNNIDLSRYSDFSALYHDIILRTDFPAQTALQMKDACDFGDLVYGSRILYNLIISEGKNENAQHEWSSYHEMIPQMNEVDITAIMNNLQIHNPMLRKFLCDFQTALHSDDIQQAKQIISQREIAIKSASRAKTMKAGQFDPKSWYGGRRLDYRMSNAGTILNDIYVGRNGHA